MTEEGDNMMLRRLLTFALAGMLVFETPAAAYAAGTLPVAEDGGLAGDGISALPEDSADQGENNNGADTDQDNGSADTDQNNGSVDTDQGSGSTDEKPGGADQSGDNTDPGDSSTDPGSDDADQSDHHDGREDDSAEEEPDSADKGNIDTDRNPDGIDPDDTDEASDQEMEAEAGTDDKAATAEPDPEAEKQHKFSVSIAEDFTALTLQVVLEGYGEELAEAVLTYEYEDALGRVQQDTDTLPVTAVQGKDGTYELTKTVEAPALLAEQVYEVKLTVQFTDADTEEMTEVSDNVEVTAPKAYYDADKITFTCVQNNEEETQADYELAWEKGGIPAPDTVRIYYRPQGSSVQAYRETTAELSDGTVSDSILRLMAGCSYEFEMFAGGVRKSCTQEFVKTTGISLVYVSEGESRTGVYDVTRTLKVQANDDQPLADVYYVTMSYMPEGGENLPGIYPMDELTLTAENNYQTTVNTAAYSAVWLHPDTDYSICWQVTTVKGSELPDAVLYDRLHTNASKVEVESLNNGHASQKFRITFDPEDVAEIQTNGALQITLYPYLRKSDSPDFIKKGSRVQLTSGMKFSNTLDLWLLEEDTEYELSLRDEDNIAEYVRTSFRTQPDYRTLSDAKVNIDTASETFNVPVTLQVRLNHNVERESTQILFYSRKADDTEPQNWVYEGKKTASAESMIVQYASLACDRGGTYDYAMVLSDSGLALDPDLVTREGRKLTGRFTVPALIPIREITLSPDAVELNAAFPEEEGYGCRTLQVLTKPATANRLYGWMCSDRSVVSLDSGTGKITARAPGEATVTVKGAVADGQTEAAADDCLVRVGNYQVRYQETGSDQITVPDGNQITLPKGAVFNGRLVLVSVGTDGSETVVPEEAYTIESGNAGVVTIKNGVLQAHNAGTTRLIFTQKGVTNGWKSYVTWTTLASGRQFFITGLLSSDQNYPAVENGDGYAIACDPDIAYRAEGEISSGEQYDPGLFTWTMADTQIASVDASGVIRAVAPGSTSLTVEPKNKDDGTWRMQEPLSIPITVTQIPETNSRVYYRYTLINMHKKLGDVKCPLEGWEWEYPDTPLVVNGVVANAYFNMICRQDGNYPKKCEVNVLLAEVTGAAVIDNEHDGVVEVSGADDTNGDIMSLEVKAQYYGSFNPYAASSDYSNVRWTIPEVAGLQIDMGNATKDGYRFTVRAERPGTYTLRPMLTLQDADGKTKVLAKTTYKIRAVEGPLAKSIELTPVLEEQGGLTFDQENNRIVMDAALIGKEGAGISKDTGSAAGKAANTFDINAVVKDRSGQELDTKLVWKSSDKKVAAVSVSGDTHRATVSLKGEGHAVLTATAKDALGVNTTLRVEIQNHEPRVNVSKIKVNTVYDYTQEAGRTLAREYSGVLETLPVYGEELRSVLLYEKDVTDHGQNGLTLYDCGGNEWLVCPDEDLETGNLQRTLRIETSAGKTYEYPLTVSLVKKQPKATVKQVQPVNLFYTNTLAEFQLNVPVGYRDIKEVRWESQAEESGRGFKAKSEGLYVQAASETVISKFAQKQIDLNQRKKPADTNLFKGVLRITVKGYKEPFTVKTSIKCVYKKPVIVTQASTTAMSPASNTLKETLAFYNKTEGRSLYYYPDRESVTDYYQGVVCDNRSVNITTTAYSRTLLFSYKRSAGQKKATEKITFTLDSGCWREPLSAIHTIKLGVPKAYLSTSRIVFNTNRLSAVSTEVLLKDVDTAFNAYDDIVITGKNAKARKLLAEDLLMIRRDGNKITVSPTKEKTTVSGKGTASLLPAGTYAYKIVPYYTDVNGERKAANALTLNVKIVNKPITVKVKTKGTLDLTRAQPSAGQVQLMNRIVISSVFNNIGTDYTVKDMELTGSYSDSFKFTRDGKTTGGTLNLYGYRLRAGRTYKLYMRYTIAMADGSSYQVVSAPFNVKPKHSTPKLKITGNNQTLYASAENVSRIYGLETPKYKKKGTSEYFYNHQISSVYGSLDCNKDGIPDIEVQKISTGSNSYKCNLDVRITDRDGLLAATGTKGKTYTIPITVKLSGRDGISSDVKTSVKVTVKR